MGEKVAMTGCHEINLIKTLILEDKKKKNVKKVTCRVDTVKARSLPMIRRGCGRGKRGRLGVGGTKIIRLIIKLCFAYEIKNLI